MFHVFVGAIGSTGLAQVSRTTKDVIYEIGPRVSVAGGPKVAQCVADGTVFTKVKVDPKVHAALYVAQLSCDKPFRNLHVVETNNKVHDEDNLFPVDPAFASELDQEVLDNFTWAPTRDDFASSIPLPKGITFRAVPGFSVGEDAALSMNRVVASQDACRQLCLADTSCKTFSYREKKTTCMTYTSANTVDRATDQDFRSHVKEEYI